MSFMSSAVEQNWRNCGCPLQTARNVSLDFQQVNMLPIQKRKLLTHVLVLRSFAALYTALSDAHEAF